MYIYIYIYIYIFKVENSSVDYKHILFNIEDFIHNKMCIQNILIDIHEKMI